jgi:hypothetical protein
MLAQYSLEIGARWLIKTLPLPATEEVTAVCGARGINW